MNVLGTRFRLALPVILALAAFLIALAAVPNTASAASRPSGLSAAVCGDAVCLSWSPGSSEFSYQQVLSWEGTVLFDRYYGNRHTVGPHTAQSQVKLSDLSIEPSANSGETVVYSFQIVGVDVSGRGGGPANHYSNRVTLHLPRPYAGGQLNPGGLSAEMCGNSVCLSWTPGTGDFAYQEIRYWQMGNPANLDYRGGQLTGPRRSGMEIPIEHLNRSRDHNGDAVYTFQVSSMTSDNGRYEHVGYSNEVDVRIPSHLMERPDNNDGKHKTARPGNGGGKGKN